MGDEAPWRSSLLGVACHEDILQIYMADGCHLSTHKCIFSIQARYCSPLVLECFDRWDEEPPKGYDQSDTCADTECPHRPKLVKERPARQCSEEKGNDRDDFMVARDDEAVEVEELGLSHELAIHRGQDDWGGGGRSN